MNLDNIPAELAPLPRWCGWRKVLRKGKWTKVLIDPATGQFGDSTDAQTWGTLQAATDRYLSDHLDGIGIALAPPFWGADLDKCRDPETAIIEAWAWDIIRELDSYTEASPSGTGVHIIGRGVLPSGGRRRGRVEVYQTGRFLTFTGAHIEGTPLTVNERTPQLAAWHARIFGQPERASNGAKSRANWTEPTAPPHDLREKAACGRIRRETLALLDSTGPAGYDSPSEADAAIAAGLIGAGLTEAEAYTVLADSVRGRDAFERKGERHGEYYLRRTVAHAAEFVGPVLEHEGLRLRRIGKPGALRTVPVREVL
jgi:primase-polymerase (primpol)-like protein